MRQPPGLRARPVSTVTRPLGGATLLGGTIVPSDLLAPLSVLVSQNRALLEHLGGPYEHHEQALWVRPGTGDRACRT
ncbi:MAG TPA: hypothetical protein VMA96_14275 [Solirubrobacteraceae bacterium]|nr:hypothetical protein [Solirubrobacteraceae bacterium]